MTTDKQRVSVGARIRRLLIAVAITLVWMAPSGAGEVNELSITENDGEYHVRILMLLDAPAQYVYQVITDFENANRICPAVTRTELLEPPDDLTVRLRNYLKYCFVTFCYDLEWVGDIRALPNGYLEMDTVPELSNFKYGSSIWNVHPLGNRTEVLHETVMKPDFYVPPLIGKLLMKFRFRHEILATFDRIESEAKSEMGGAERNRNGRQ
jgi:hypothetical protein